MENTAKIKFLAASASDDVDWRDNLNLVLRPLHLPLPEKVPPFGFSKLQAKEPYGQKNNTLYIKNHANH